MAKENRWTENPDKSIENETTKRSKRIWKGRERKKCKSVETEQDIF